MIEPAPASVIKAICEVQKSFNKAIPKTGRNEYAKFDYVSVDSIYGAVSNHMAHAELTIHTFEESAVEERISVNGKTALFVTFKFRVVLATPEATWAPPQYARTLRVRIEGPQSFAAAVSFFEKSIIRSLFKLPTGSDVELDLAKQGETLEDQVDEKPLKKRKSSAQAKKDGDGAKFETLRHTIQTCRDSSALDEIMREHTVADMFDKWPRAWAALLTDEYVDRHSDLVNNGA